MITTLFLISLAIVVIIADNDIVKKTKGTILIVLVSIIIAQFLIIEHMKQKLMF